MGRALTEWFFLEMNSELSFFLAPDATPRVASGAKKRREKAEQIRADFT